MRNRKYLILPLLFVLAAVSGCKDSDVRKAARAADGIAQGLSATADGIAALHEAKLLDDAEAKVAAQLNREATVALDVFIAKAKTLKDIDPGNKALLAQWFGELAQSLDRLNQEGILRVKNPEAKAKLQVIFAAVKASADIISGILGVAPTEARPEALLTLNSGGGQ